MTDRQQPIGRAIVCSRRRGCRTVNLSDPRLLDAMAEIPPPRAPRVPSTQVDPAWEASRHAEEAKYWAEHLEEFARRLPRIRRNRGDDRSRSLVRDTLAEIRAARGTDEAVLARDLLFDVWRKAALPASLRAYDE